MGGLSKARVVYETGIWRSVKFVDTWRAKNKGSGVMSGPGSDLEVFSKIRLEGAGKIQVKLPG